jgi:hypothetical protein
MSSFEYNCGRPAPVTQILRAWRVILETTPNGMGQTVLAVAEHAAVGLWQRAAMLPSAELEVARALSASAVLASELDRRHPATAEARSAALRAVNILAALLHEAQPNALAEVA